MLPGLISLAILSRAIRQNTEQYDCAHMPWRQIQFADTILQTLALLTTAFPVQANYRARQRQSVDARTEEGRPGTVTRLHFDLVIALYVLTQISSGRQRVMAANQSELNEVDVQAHAHRRVKLLSVRRSVV